MIYLLLSIFSSTVIFITFKFTEHFKANLVNLITINYLAAAVLGFSLNPHKFTFSQIFTFDWLSYACVIGVSYMVMFFLIGYSIRKSGIAVTTIAGKLSMVIPILFSILFYHEKQSTFKTTGLVLAVISVLLSSYRPINKAKNVWLIVLPFLIFIGTGATDALVKYMQGNHISNQTSLLFSSFVFTAALLSGILVMIFQPKSTSKNLSFSDTLGGIVLGIANFGSLYFFIMALSNSRLESSIVFGLNSICIVLFSVLVGWAFFKEKFSNINFAGIIMAFIVILLLMNF